MSGFQNYLQAGVLAIGVLACASAASAQTWSSPVTIANGNGLAVATNGSGTSAVIFTPSSGGVQASVNTGGGWPAPTTLTSVTAPANITVAPNGDVLAVWSFRTTNTYTPVEAQGCLLPRWTLGKYGHSFDQCLWKRLQPRFAQYRVRRIRPGNRGVGADHQS